MHRTSKRKEEERCRCPDETERIWVSGLAMDSEAHPEHNVCEDVHGGFTAKWFRSANKFGVAYICLLAGNEEKLPLRSPTFQKCPRVVIVSLFKNAHPITPALEFHSLFSNAKHEFFSMFDQFFQMRFRTCCSVGTDYKRGCFFFGYCLALRVRPGGAPRVGQRSAISKHADSEEKTQMSSNQRGRPQKKDNELNLHSHVSLGHGSSTLSSDTYDDLHTKLPGEIHAVPTLRLAPSDLTQPALFALALLQTSFNFSCNSIQSSSPIDSAFDFTWSVTT